MNYSSAINILSENMAFLDDMDYLRPVEEIIRSESIGTYLDFTITARNGSRRISIVYSRGTGGDENMASVLISDESGNRFGLIDWIRARRWNINIPFYSKGGASREKKFLETLTAGIRVLLEGPLRDTVAGRAWDSVPMDWMGNR